MNNHKAIAKNWRQEKVDAGLCGYCGKERTHCSRLCDECQIKQNKHSQRYVDKTRHSVIEAYGGKCACCGEANPGFLTMDHPNNDGAEHRRITKCGTGAKFYVWLKKNNYPKEFQLMCWNCNCGKRDNGGICPHVTEQL